MGQAGPKERRIETMNSQTHKTTSLSDSPENRARNMCVMGLVLQTALCAFLLVVSIWNGSLAVQGEVRFAVAGLGVWLMLLLIFHQRKLVRIEALEAADLREQRESAGMGSEAIFEVDEEQLMLARRRLGLMLKWFVPGVTLLLAGYYVAAGILYWPVLLTEGMDSESWPTVGNTRVSATFLVGAAFVTFLFSRYASGMSRREEWRELRAGASNLFGNALLCAALAGMLGLSHFEIPVPERVTALVIRILLIFLGLELMLNLVVDLYRPRVAGEIGRPAFDSRLLGLFSESGGIARSIAEAINYQFGFEVSSTWFYQLMYRATIPLTAFGVLCVMGVSSFVVVEPHERAIIERFGVMQQASVPLGPGMHFKFPWPIDRAYKFPVKRLQQVMLGGVEVGGDDEEANEAITTVLWTTDNHGAAVDNYVLVAIPPDEPRGSSVFGAGGDSAETHSEQSVPVSILRAMAPIHYRIRDLYRFGYAYSNPERLLRGIADRELIRYAASADVDGIMGAHRAEAARTLRERIQSRADELDLGVEIVFVGLQDFHPDKSVAKAFQQVVGALQEREALEEQAKGKAIEMLAEVSGDADMALLLAESIRRASELKRTEPADSAALAQAVGRRDALFSRASGEVSAIMAGARAYRWNRENAWLSRAERFKSELLSYRASPSVYSYRRYLMALSEGLENVRKFLLATDTEGRTLTFIIDQQNEETFRGLR